MDNQGNSLNNIVIMKIDEHTLILIKNSLHQQILHTQMCEDSIFHNSNVTHTSRNNYQVLPPSQNYCYRMMFSVQ